MKRNPEATTSRTVIFLAPNYDHAEGTGCDNGINHHKLQARLQEVGISAKFITPYRKPLNPFENWNFFIRSLDFARAIWVMLVWRKADAIVSIFESGGLFIVLLRRIFFFRPKVLLWDASIGNRWRVVKAIQSVTFPRYDGYMMLTTSQIEAIQPQSKAGSVFAHIGYQVDEDFFHPRYNVAEDYILTVGDDESRDFETFYRALAETGLPVVMKTKWRPNLDELPPNDRIRFVSERLDDRSYRDLYAKACFVVVPLRFTEHPGGITSLFEAMAMGKPLIVSDSPIARDFLIPDISGVIVPRGDVEAMRDQLQAIWTDRVLRECLGKSARSHLEESWCTAKLAEAMGECLNEVTA